jgi:hypothetical protein
MWKLSLFNYRFSVKIINTRNKYGISAHPCIILYLLMINNTSSHELNYNVLVTILVKISNEQNLTILQCIIKIKNYVTKNNYLFKTLIMLGKNCYRTYQFYIWKKRIVQISLNYTHVRSSSSGLDDTIVSCFKCLYFVSKYFVRLLSFTKRSRAADDGQRALVLFTRNCQVVNIQPFTVTYPADLRFTDNRTS